MSLATPQPPGPVPFAVQASVLAIGPGADGPGICDQLRVKEGDAQRILSVSVTAHYNQLPKLNPLDGVEMACQYLVEKRGGWL